MEHCTCSAEDAAFRVHETTPLGDDLPRLKVYVTDSLFIGPTGEGDSQATVLARDSEADTPSRVAWWARRNAFATSLSDYIRTADAGQPGVELKQQWLAFWGAGHEVNGLSEGTDVIFESAFPTWSELQPKDFKLSESGAASHSASDGTAAGAAIAHVGAGQAPADSGSGGSSGPQKRRSTPPKKPRLGF